jgi:hypothetical protein
MMCCQAGFFKKDYEAGAAQQITASQSTYASEVSAKIKNGHKGRRVMLTSG